MKHFLNISPTPYDSTVYTYDSENRLVSGQHYLDNEIINGFRYVYNSAGNVISSYFVVLTGQPQVPGATFTTYDNHSRFYAASPDLEQIEIYVYGYYPSVNNVLKGSVSAEVNGVISTTFPTPQALTMALTYDNKGNVFSRPYTNLYPELIFDKMIYSCK